jgi:hypothetical protein
MREAFAPKTPSTSARGTGWHHCASAGVLRTDSTYADSRLAVGGRSLPVSSIPLPNPSSIASHRSYSPIGFPNARRSMFDDDRPLKSPNEVTTRGRRSDTDMTLAYYLPDHAGVST